MDLSLQSMTIYPIKSCAGIAVQEARMEERGLQYDRRFMIVDESGTCVTQRTYPQMALITTGIEGEELVLKAQGMPTLHVPLQPRTGGRVLVGVWRSLCLALAVSREADAWISQYVGAKLQLVYMPDETRRAVNPTFSNTHIVSFADGYPMLLVSAASLDDLNRRMDVPVAMNRFRPNLVVAGSEPFAEDGWRQVRIGGIVLRATKCCVRCMIPMIDQETGRQTGKEPLRTLSTFRMKDRQITFGLYMLPLSYTQEFVRIGEAVEVIEEDASGL